MPSDHVFHQQKLVTSLVSFSTLGMWMGLPRWYICSFAQHILIKHQGFVLCSAFVGKRVCSVGYHYLDFRALEFIACFPQGTWHSVWHIGGTPWREKERKKVLCHMQLPEWSDAREAALYLPIAYTFSLNKSGIVYGKTRWIISSSAYSRALSSFNGFTKG